MAAEVEIGANSDANMQDRQEPNENANNMDSNASAPNATNAPRRTVEYVSLIGTTRSAHSKVRFDNIIFSYSSGERAPSLLSSAN